jgi:hypothetical protein
VPVQQTTDFSTESTLRWNKIYYVYSRGNQDPMENVMVENGGKYQEFHRKCGPVQVVDIFGRGNLLDYEKIIDTQLGI